MLRRITAMLLTTAIIATSFAGSLAKADTALQTSFEQTLIQKYSDIEQISNTEVRWWLAQGAHTDQTIIEELNAMHDAGFSGVELCQLADTDVDNTVYGYGSEEWNHDVKLILDTALDLGMTVSLVSGAGWKPANIPGLDPDSQAANQCIALVKEDIGAGASRSGAIATSTSIREKASLIGAYAVPRTTETSFTKEFRIIEDAPASALTEFTVEADVIIEREDTGLLLGVTDKNHFIYLQINANYQAGKVYYRPHVQNNGWKGSTNIDITSVVGSDIIGKKLHIKVAVKNGVINTWFDGVAVTSYTIPTTASAYGSNFKLAKLGFRHETNVKYSRQSLARWDNIVVTDASGKVVKSYDFNDGVAGFSDVGGVKVEDGMLVVGQPQYVSDLPALITDSEYFSLQTKSSLSDPTTFTIEGDFVITKQATGFCFGTRNGGNDCLMWEINCIASGGDEIYLRPHTRIGKKWTRLSNVDVTAAIGHTSSSVIGKTVHIKIEVTDGKTIETYFNGTLAHTMDVPETATMNANGEFSVGDIMFRHKTSSKYSNEALAIWDNLTVSDENGKIIFSENFENKNSVGFATGTGAEVKNGMLYLGVAQPEVTAGENTFESEGIIDLTPLVTNGTLSWTAPYDRNYSIMYYYMQGTAQSVAPATKTSYVINLFDRAGVEAVTSHLADTILNDKDLNEKIRSGNVQLFMDSLEYTNGAGMTAWTSDFANEFKSRKGYDVLPYMFITSGAPNTSIWGWSNNADLLGTYTLTDMKQYKKIMDDIFDVQTELYMEEFLTPFKEWLNSYGIKLRVQISYGKNLEISEPISVVDYPEAENRNQKNQVDMYRLWSGGAHLQNKVLSSETGGLDSSGYSYTYQKHLQEAYMLYSAGYSRMIWHIWASDFGPTASWPGYEGGDGKAQYYKFGMREPSYDDYAVFNDHLGRVQKLLREGRAGVDIGMLYTKYGQHLLHRNRQDWIHTHESMFFPSTVLQDNGYTYDYLASDLLSAEGVYFDKSTKTLELAGYKALVLWQDDLSVSGAKRVLSLASEGMPIVIVNGAATVSPYASDSDDELKSVISQLTQLENVKTVSNADAVINALSELGISPYVAFLEPNQQILTQTRRDGDNRYVYAYNYCDGSLHNVANSGHGDSITTTFTADGTFIPYYINSWTGDVTKLAGYRHVNGKTEFDITLNYGDVALFALEAVDSAFTAENAEYEKDGKFYYNDLQDGFEINNWNLNVESWTPSDEIVTRTENLFGTETVEYSVKTDKTNISVTLDTLDTWDNVEAIGKSVSGKGYYSASFEWDANADGAYLDLGRLTQSAAVRINGKDAAAVNMNNPVIDISDLLISGSNTVEIVYSSNLNNIQLSRGAITEGVLPSNFLGYETGYQSYGIQSATVIPYTRTEIVVAPEITAEDNKAMLSADARRVYWGYIGTENTEYKWFNDFKAECGDTFTSEYASKANDTYELTRKGFYRFVVNEDGKDYVYTVECTKDSLPAVDMSAENAVATLSGNARKVYFGYIGEENTAYAGFAPFKEICGDTFTADFSPRDNKAYRMEKEGYYRFVVNYLDQNGKSHDKVFTFKCENAGYGIPKVTYADGKITLNSNEATINKMYIGYFGKDEVEVTSWSEFTANSIVRTCIQTPADSYTTNLKNKGCYVILVNYTDENSKVKDKYFTFIN